MLSKYHHCGLAPQSPCIIANVRRYRIKCGMTGIVRHIRAYSIRPYKKTILNFEFF